MKRINNIILSMAFLFSVWMPKLGHSAEVTRLVDPFYNNKLWDIAVKANYEMFLKKSSIVREYACSASSPNSICPNGDSIVNAKELNYSQMTHLMNFDLVFAFIKQLALSIRIPVILSSTTELTFPSGTTNVNSTVDRLPEDNVYPVMFNMPFSGPKRVGLGDITIGLAWTPFNDLADPSKPTWLIGFEYTAPSGSLQTADNTAVGSKIHWLRFRTALSKRLNIFDPYFLLKYNYPVADSNSNFKKYSEAQTLINPSQRVDIFFGTEIVPWQNRRAEQKFSIDIRFIAGWVSEGRGYSELWEALGSSTYPVIRKQNPLLDPTGPDRPDLTGMTDIQEHGIVGGALTLNWQAHKFFFINTGFSIIHEMEHFLTFAKAGKDFNQSGHVDDPAEKNPVYNEYHDLVGRRFRARSTVIYNFFLTLAGTFSF